MSIQLPDLSNSINSQLIDKSLPSPSNRQHKSNVNPPRRLVEYYLGAVGKNSVDGSSNSNCPSNDDLTIEYAYPDYGSTVPSPLTNYVYSTTCFNGTVNVNLNFINFSPN